MITEHDRRIVRELAKKYMSLVTSEKQERIRQRCRATNDLRQVRPPVILSEIPWYQIDIDGELTCVCEDPQVRDVEAHFRRALYYLKHFKADNLFEPFFRVRRTRKSDGYGVDRKIKELRRTDDTNNIVSRELGDAFADESVLEQMHDPVFTLHPDVDAARMEFCTSLLGDSIPIRLYGYNALYCSPWDLITYMRGVEPIMMDMYDRPEFLHAIMDRFVSAYRAELDFVEKNLDIDADFSDLHCTPAAISPNGESGLRSTWYRGMAQSFDVISPAMFEEFEIDHIRSLASRFGHVYYGCCEALDNKIDVLKKNLPNLRKIGCSPWANLEACAEQIGSDYVLSRKPNPAHVSDVLDTDVIRREAEETAKACIRYACPFDYVLKDISTVSHHPENLILWSKTVSDVFDRYFGEA